MMIKRKVLCFTFLFFALFSAIHPAAAKEEILSYDVTVRLDRDASATVTEKIRATVEHNKINHGFYRTLPQKGGVPYEIIEVLRDGKREPFSIEKQGPDAGEDAQFPLKETTFEITYRVKKVIRSSQYQDELYWNVTGDNWTFPILKATAKIIVPDGAEIIERRGYGGRSGSQKAVKFSDDLFSSTSTLPPKTGMTVVVRFAKGFFNIPKPFVQLKLITRITPAYLILLAFLFVTWWLYGRDPEKGAVVPRYDILPDITPAFAGYIKTYGVSEDKLAGIALLQAVISKFLKIRRVKKDSFVFYKIREPETEEERIMDSVFTFPETVNRSTVRRRTEKDPPTKMEVFHNQLIAFFEKQSRPYFEENSRCSLIAGLLFILLGVWIYACYDLPSPYPDLEIRIKKSVLFTIGEAPVPQPTFSLLAFALVLSGFALATAVLEEIFRSREKFFGTLYFAFVCIVFFLAFITDFEKKITMLSPTVIAYIVVGCLSLFPYFFLIKRPTEKGTAVLEYLDGVEMFLNSVQLYKTSFDNMEKLMPYAAVLNMEKQYDQKTKALFQQIHFGSEDWGYATAFSSFLSLLFSPKTKKGNRSR